MGEMKGRQPTSEERALWRAVTRHDVRFQETPKSEDEKQETVVRMEDVVRAERFAVPKLEKTRRAVLPELETNNLSALDGARAKRLKRGAIPPDWVLDLHGMGREAAYDTVGVLIHEAVESHMRCLLIVTGKGRGGEGVLRRELPHWLNEPRLRAQVVALAHAPLHLGGEGAYLVYLRNPRKVRP
jgi:DNA-nicking Smr family endonuclease